MTENGWTEGYLVADYEWKPSSYTTLCVDLNRTTHGTSTVSTIIKLLYLCYINYVYKYMTLLLNCKIIALIYTSHKF